MTATAIRGSRGRPFYLTKPRRLERNKDRECGPDVLWLVNVYLTGEPNIVMGCGFLWAAESCVAEYFELQLEPREYDGLEVGDIVLRSMLNEQIRRLDLTSSDKEQEGGNHE